MKERSDKYVNFERRNLNTQGHHFLARLAAVNFSEKNSATGRESVRLITRNKICVRNVSCGQLG